MSDRYRAMAADARCEANAAEWISGLANCKAMAMSAQIVTADKLRLKSKLVELLKLGMQAVDDAVSVQLGLRK